MTDDNPTRRRYLHLTSGATFAALAGCRGDGGGGDSTDDGMVDVTATDDGTMATTFEVTVENVSSGDTLETMAGGVAVPLSPGVYAVHSGMAHLFAPGEPASAGLESLAEDGKPGTLAGEVADADGILHSGTFTTPAGAEEPAPIGPGERYSFQVEASAEADPSLSLATMFVQSNDLFDAPGPDGVALFEDGDPGEGDDQAPRQSGPDTGAAEDGTVRRIGDVDDGHDYPAVSDVLSVSVTTM
jgi:hypothetical protein